MGQRETRRQRGRGCREAMGRTGRPAFCNRAQAGSAADTGKGAFCTAAGERAVRPGRRSSGGRERQGDGLPGKGGNPARCSLRRKAGERAFGAMRGAGNHALRSAAPAPWAAFARRADPHGAGRGEQVFTKSENLPTRRFLPRSAPVGPERAIRQKAGFSGMIFRCGG